MHGFMGGISGWHLGSRIQKSVLLCYSFRDLPDLKIQEAGRCLPWLLLRRDIIPVPYQCTRAVITSGEKYNAASKLPLGRQSLHVAAVRHTSSPFTPKHVHVSNHFRTNPSPLPTTSFLGSTSTFRLSSFRSSGVIIFLAASLCAGVPGEAVLPPREGGGAGPLDELPPAVVVGVVGASDADPGSRRRGAGKFSFLSAASTRRWKRRKRASARTSVESRSIEPESSLTVGAWC